MLLCEHEAENAKKEALAKFTAQDVAEAVLDLFLETGEDVSTEAIAQRLGCSVSTVRRLMNRNFGSVAGVDAIKHSTEAGRLVWKYCPSVESLRRLIIKLRRSAS